MTSLAADRGCNKSSASTGLPNPDFAPGTGRVSMKRKRAKHASLAEEHPTGPPAKQPKRGADGNLQSAHVVKHALLAQYYPKVQTLRQYVLDKLPPTSRIRRKKIAAIGSAESDADAAAQGCKGNPRGIGAVLAELLDTTLIGTHDLPKEVAKAQSDSLLQRWIDYSQTGDDSYVTLFGGVTSAIHFQSEVSMLCSQCGLGTRSSCCKLITVNGLWLLADRRLHHLAAFLQRENPRYTASPPAL